MDGKMSGSIASLSEQVRLYVRARYISEGRVPSGKQPVKHTVSTDAEIVAFGDVSAKEVSKAAQARKRRAKKKRFVADPGLLASLAHGAARFTSDELASLREQAMLAIEQASELAGEPVHYCDAGLRTEAECWGTCKDNPVYQEVNQL